MSKVTVKSRINGKPVNSKIEGNRIVFERNFTLDSGDTVEFNFQVEIDDLIKPIRTIDRSLEELRERHEDFMRRAMIVVQAIRAKGYPETFTQECTEEIQKALHDLVGALDEEN